MRPTNFRSTNTTFPIPLTVYLLVIFGSAWLVWFALWVVILTWGFALVDAVRLWRARAQKGLREQTIQIGVSSI
jgi:hypothetical protein